jgi:hypothetical protein
MLGCSLHNSLLCTFAIRNNTRSELFAFRAIWCLALADTIHSTVHLQYAATHVRPKSFVFIGAILMFGKADAVHNILDITQISFDQTTMHNLQHRCKYDTQQSSGFVCKSPLACLFICNTQQHVHLNQLQIEFFWCFKGAHIKQSLALLDQFNNVMNLWSLLFWVESLIFAVLGMNYLQYTPTKIN